MKIQVLVRSPDWLNSAGTRIRYRRLQSDIAKLGCNLSIDAMSNIREGLKLNADVYLFSKCQDAGALMLADMLREAGAVVGFDLFDDYLSGVSSATFAQREFQRALSGRVDFLLCSTNRMMDVAKAMDPAIPIHILNDPFASSARERLDQLLESKAERVRQTGQVEVLWFGVGHNPLFPVGISDLVAFGGAMRPLSAAGLDVRIKVLTNADALESDGLKWLRNLSYPTEVEEWSDHAEQASLDRATIAFLPVNYQGFSIAKSLNRAVTALTHGAQILSAGYPLYAALDAFVYQDAAELAEDLDGGSAKLNALTLNHLDRCLASLADPANEAARLLTFLTALPVGTAKIPVDQRRLRAVVHGAASTPAVHMLGRALGWLSLASPLTRQNLPYDARIGFFDEGATPELRLTHKAVMRLAEGWFGQATMLPISAQDEYSHVLPLPESDAGALLRALTRPMLQTRAGRMVHCNAVMSATDAVFRDVFGDLIMMQSELEIPLQCIAQRSATAARA